jgi:hypothetical protein
MLALLLAYGCTPDPEITGGCELAPDNALRATCTFAVDPPGPIALTLTPEAGGGPVLVRELEGPGEIPVWRMTAETRYEWVARSGDGELSGDFTTGSLPPQATLRVDPEGDPGPDDVLFVVDCGEVGQNEPTAVVVDPEGRVVWYQPLTADLPPGPHRAVGLEFSEEGTLLAVVDQDRVREYTLDGTLVKELIAGDQGSAEVLHHDVFRRDGRTFVLNARIQEVGGVDYIVDGLSGFEPDGTLFADWDLSEIATVSGEGGVGAVYWTDLWPDAEDWSHANGLYVDADGDWIVSLHTFSTVLRIEGDPADPAFGTPVWVLDGSGTSPWPSDFVVTDPDGLTDDEVFGHQHHPSLLPDGSMQLFDNGDQIVDPARVLRLGLDEGAGEAQIRGSWPLGEICPIEGSAYVLSDGTLLATCGLQASYSRIRPEDGDILGTTTAVCEGGTPLPVLPRAIPIPLEELVPGWFNGTLDRMGGPPPPAEGQ